VVTFTFRPLCPSYPRNRWFVGPNSRSGRSADDVSLACVKNLTPVTPRLWVLHKLRIPQHVIKPEVHCRVHYSPPLVPILSQTNPSTTSNPTALRPILILTSCYALRNIKHIVPIDTLRVIYFAHIHSIISYGIIFGGSSSHANKVFILQKKIVRIITNTRPRDSCREVFKSMEIMTYSQHIYSLVLYTINNKHLFDTNNEIHKYKTRNNNNLHCPVANLSKFNNGAYISGIKVFNHLPQYIKAFTNDHK
jgi:hypothetical protein